MGNADPPSRPRSLSPPSSHRYRSRSPRRANRDRSLSPDRGRRGDSPDRERTPTLQGEIESEPGKRKEKKAASGFKWKENSKRDHDRTTERGERGGLERGYREQEKPSRRRTPPPTSPSHREGVSRNDVSAKFGNSNSVSDKFGDTVTKSASDIADKFGAAAAATAATTTTSDAGQVDQTAANEEKKKKKKKRTAGPRPTTEEMIIVNVNDRLGTKASIPCLASDPISTFSPNIGD